MWLALLLSMAFECWPLERPTVQAEWKYTGDYRDYPGGFDEAIKARNKGR